MGLNFRFAVVSDLHIALPSTIWDHPSRFHLVEVSISALELVLEHLQQLHLDFLLIPGDLTQHGEPENHRWLSHRLAQLPFPVYVIPGNHDVPVLQANHQSIAWADFPYYYPQQGYQNPRHLYYTCQPVPGVRLIALNSNQFNQQGQQIGRVDDQQLQWLEGVLTAATEELILVMIHHNVVEHLPNQSNHCLGRRYMLENALEFCQLLKSAGVQLVLTGHLHVQDIAEVNGIYDITTGSLVSYPHPYRILQISTDAKERQWLQIESHQITRVPGWPELASTSRQWMADRSFPFMLKLLMEPPLNLSQAMAEKLAPQLQYFWADIAAGDGIFDYPDFPSEVRQYFQSFNAQKFIDNHATILLKH